MNVEMTPEEAAVLIAVLTAAEDAFAWPDYVDKTHARMVAELRPFRSALLMAFLRAPRVTP